MRGGRFSAAADSGGRVWHAPSLSKLTDAFAQVVDELEGRYLLRYTPRGVPTGGWHTLKVRVHGADVRARSGYQGR